MKKTILVIAVVIAAGLLLNSFLKSSPKEANPFQFGIRLSPDIPKDVRLGASETELASFAWNQFFAVNWRSNYNPQNKVRGYPDRRWDYTTTRDPYPDHMVWETFAHRTELRPAHGLISSFDKIPHYSFGDSILPADGADQTLFNNLDENNEIGSCNVYAHADKYQQQIRVLYQAKCNRDEYEYIQTTYPTNDSLKAATTRTALNITNDSSYYKGAPLLNGTCNCPPQERVICLPCGNSPIPGGNGATYTGAIEVKTAWRPLVKEDRQETYMTRKVIVYEKRGKQVYAVNKVYGLIGLHIIHKTTNYPDFIFATWEHVDAYDSNMEYFTIRNNQQDPTPHYKYKRINDIRPVTKASTIEAHRLLKQQNPNSIWQYYQLVGVQGFINEDPKSPNYFLANYVIESDSALQLFRGNSVRDPFNKMNNILFLKHGYLYGGCKGCHGVAQVSLGTDFSFLLDQIGKPVDTPDTYNENSSRKLLNYIEGIRQAELIKQQVLEKKK